ncbi:hypothetical protein [Glutamicibacter arilaitensis]|uniref:hypothetical protein n=1 Tax=Glutamicibacter arilaitensis TaxID=256701 RepID=UPI00384B90B0
MSEYSIQFWVTIGTLATAAATIGLVIGAFMAWHKAKQTLVQMQKDAITASENFDRDIMQRERHEGERRTDATMSGLLSAASDLVAATNVSLHAVYAASMELRKANLNFVMTFELQKGQGSLEQFCACLSLLAKSSHATDRDLGRVAKDLANQGFEQLFQTLLSFQREDIDMPGFLDGIYSFAEEVSNNHMRLIGKQNWKDGRIVKWS